MAEEPPSKLARIQSLRSRLPYVSQSALAALLKIAEQEELPTGASRTTLRRARDAVREVRTTYGSLHQTLSFPLETGEILEVEVQNPFAALCEACRSSAAFSAMVSRCAAASPSSLARPWKLVLYMDEILPGNQLAYTNERKMWGFYWTLLDFGSAALSDEDLPDGGILNVPLAASAHFVDSTMMSRHVSQHSPW